MICLSDLIPAGLDWCIAGGYAACPALARDIDVWIYNIASEDLESQRDLLAQELSRVYRCAFVPSTETRASSSYLQDKISILKVGEVIQRKPIHLIVTDAGRPMDILCGFDVSTHAVATLPNGDVVVHPLYTHPGQPPIALASNEKTPERLARIAARFGHSEVTPNVPF